MTKSDDVVAHYDVRDLDRRVREALRAAGKTDDVLEVDDLAPIDAFHVRGRAATAELAGWVKLAPEHRVLDVGGGIGGTARYLAASFGCHVSGVDLVTSYARAAAMLSRMTGLSDRTAFHVAPATALPFAAERFDVVWTENVQMNVRDKRAFYGEALRVLAPGGRLAFNDVFAGPGGAPRFPVPWASERSISHLVPLGEVKALLADLGARVVRCEDRSTDAIAFFRKVVERVRTRGLPPLSLEVLMGEEAPEKLTNLLANLEEDRVRAVQAVFEKPR